MLNIARKFYAHPGDNQAEFAIIPASALSDFSSMSLELASILDYLMPGDASGLLAITEKESVDWSSLEPTIVDFIASGMEAGQTLNPNPSGRVMGASGPLSVWADHLVNDYWWLECKLERNPGSQTQTAPSELPALAVLRVRHSRYSLPYTARTSPRITQNDFLLAP